MITRRMPLYVRSNDYGHTVCTTNSTYSARHAPSNGELTISHSSLCGYYVDGIHHVCEKKPMMAMMICLI